jgi:hypothetical protein
MADKNEASKARLTAEGLSIAFMSLVVFAANALALFYILFPELGALASDVLERPLGKWAKEPWKLVATPVVTAVIGIAINLNLSYGVLSILVTMVLSLGVIFALRSAVAPAISAGILPIVLGVKSWFYPLCILGTLVTLTLILLIWRVTSDGKILSGPAKKDDAVVEVLETAPKGKHWFPALFLFVAIVGAVAQVTGWRFILFPPLVVMAYEMLGHPETCPWAKQPWTFPVVCTAAALAGVEAVLWLGVSPLGAALVMVVAFICLRVARLRMPPAVAIGLIPFVLPHPSWKYAVSVAIGTLALTIWFLGYRAFMLKPIALRV